MKSTISKTKVFINDFLSTNERRFIYGINKYSDSIFENLERIGLKIEAFIDDYTSEEEYKGIKIIRSMDLKDQVGKVVVVTCNTKTALDKLRALDNPNLSMIDYFSFSKYANLDLLEIEFFDIFVRKERNSNFKDFQNDYNMNKDKYCDVYQMLADKESRQHFSSIINFRINKDYSFIECLNIYPHKQYFEDFIDFKNVSVFVDCGGYDGANSLEYIARNPNYKKIYFFEPFVGNINLAKEKLKDTDVEFYNLALGDKEEFLYLNTSSANTSAYHLDEASTTNVNQVKVNTLDNLLYDELYGGGGIKSKRESKQNIMIKMDIESAEIQALNGSKNIIANLHPILAICVYHGYDDLYKIPQVVLAMNNKYRLYFRHYSFGIAETVMYFIPTDT